MLRSGEARRRGPLALALAAAMTLPATAQPPRFRGILITAEQAAAERLRAHRKDGANAVVLALSDDDAGRSREAARRIIDAGFSLHYWVEIGRNPALADAHPEWMASLQGHPEWRRHFPGAPRPEAGEVIKNYPWVPVLSEEASQAHLRRLALLLEDMPSPSGIFLNDLQGAPSACGCGNLLCRWTADYGPIRTATGLGNDAAARFVRAARGLAPKARIIPVWTSECEEQDREQECAGVGCFRGLCWKEYTAQLMPVASEADTLAALLPYRALGRDLPRYGAPAGWIGQALRSFSEMPPRHQGSAIPAGRLIAVLQGWEVSPEQVRAQWSRASGRARPVTWFRR